MSRFVASVSYPCEILTIAALLNRDFLRIDKWCARWGMLVNFVKTYGMMISRSRTAWPTFLDLFVSGCIAKIVRELEILGNLIDSKLTFESHVRSVVASASHRIVFWGKLVVCSEIILFHLVVFPSFTFSVLSIALQSWCILPLVTCHWLTGSFGVRLGLVVMLFAVNCGTDPELPLCRSFAGHSAGQLFPQ